MKRNTEHHRWLLPMLLGAMFLFAFVTGTGCQSVRPMANDGHDLIENPGRSMWVRIPAGLGAAAGYLVAVPVSAVLLPTYGFESQSKPSAQGYGRGEKEGDIWIPLVLAPYEYGGGMGAAILGWPFRAIAGIFTDEPPQPPGTLDEDPEPPPGTKDPQVSFAVRPPEEDEPKTP